MLASIFIICISLVLFLYWFRYTCILILNTRARRDYAPQIAAANQLSFLRTRDLLREEAIRETGAAAPSLDSLERALGRDYTLLVYLLRHGGVGEHEQAFEHQILRVDFHVMRAWYALMRRLSPARARRALLEMASIINHFANSMGERVAVSQQA